MARLERLKVLRDARLKREAALNPVIRNENVAENAEKVWNTSVKKNIPLLEADAEILTKTMDDYQKGLADIPRYKKIDRFFDPLGPPVTTVKPGELQKLREEDPLSTLLRYDIKASKKTFEYAMKAMSYIYAPYVRGFKFAVNASMYDPLLKTTTGSLRRYAIGQAAANEIWRRLAVLDREKGGYSADQKAQIIKEVNEQASEQIRLANEEGEEKVGVGDFMDSAKDAMKALIPWPGAADDVKTFGEISANAYERVSGREAPIGYALVGDMALQTTALIGISKMSWNASREGARRAAPVTLTRAEIRAIKKLHKQASQTKRIPITAAGVSSKLDQQTVTAKLIALVKNAKSRRPAKEAAIRADRIKKARKLAQVQKNVRGQKLVSATKRSLSKAAPVPDFDPINVDLSAQEIDVLFNMVNTFDFGGQTITKGAATIALDELLDGTLIFKSQQLMLEQVFGKGLTKALFGKQSIKSIIQDVSFEAINLPRALLASFDMSAAGRQGIVFSVSHPVASMKSFGRATRAALNSEYAKQIDLATRNNKWGQLADRFGVHSSPTGFTAKIGAKEEVYMSRVAESIPFGIGRGVAASERHFTTFLNQQRREVFRLQAEKWIKRGITPQNNKAAFSKYAKFVNHATGRGSLENMQPGFLTGMNAVFFSPRFQVSRVQVMSDAITSLTTKHARSAITRDLAEFYATGMGIMGMAHAGGAEVERDPRSSDFGKIKVGDTRYNYWGSFQPMARLFGQITTGQIKQTGTGKLKDKGQIKLIVGFLRSKLAPTPGRVVDLVAGETARGEIVEPTPKFIGKAAYESLVPLFVQDSVDAWRFQGANAQFPVSAGLAFTGIGVQTWDLAPFAELELAKDELARTTYGKNYDELDYDEVQFLDADIMINHPGIIDLERQVSFESEGVNFLKRQAQEQRRSERRVMGAISKPIRDAFAESNISIGGVDRVFGNWRLNDEQYKEYEKAVSKEITQLYLDTRELFDGLEPNSPERVEMLASIIRNAKLIAAQKMKIGSIE